MNSNIRTVNTILQDELQLAYKWLCCNKLSLHTGKTNSIVICSWQKRQHLSTSELELNLSGDVIEQTSNFKYLGLTIDKDLKYDCYMKDLINKINPSLGILRRASHYVDQATRITLFNTLILPHIDYCSTVWCNNVTIADINKLQCLQNVGIR